MAGNKLNLLLDHVTDVAGITALTWLASNGTVADGIVAAIVSISIGQRYAKGKWLNYQNDSTDNQ